MKKIIVFGLILTAVTMGSADSVRAESVRVRSESDDKRELNLAERSDLNELEQKSAQGEITGAQFEGRLGSLKPGATIKF